MKRFSPKFLMVEALAVAFYVSVASKFYPTMVERVQRKLQEIKVNSVKTRCGLSEATSRVTPVRVSDPQRHLKRGY